MQCINYFLKHKLFLYWVFTEQIYKNVYKGSHNNNENILRNYKFEYIK